MGGVESDMGQVLREDSHSFIIYIESLLVIFYVTNTTTMSNLNPYCVALSKPFSKRQILDSSKLEDFADDNFEFDENGRKSFKWVENTVGKGEIARYEQFLLFQKICTADT